MQSTRLLAVNETLRQLSFELGSGSRELAGHLDAIADLLKVSLDCSRVTLWLLQRRHPERTLDCTAFSSHSRTLKVSRCALPQPAVQAYLDALLASGLLAVEDVRQAPALAALDAAYCRPEGVVATLDAAFVVNGQAVGVACCEQIGQPRRWLPEEAAVLRRVAQAVTLDLARVALGVKPEDECSDEVRRLLQALSAAGQGPHTG
ncbi:GAF domain-containing protein [Aquincola sp. J276]|uniref:GAF domain-containing protein n=1 Tax=Aquincola sp. J276 TaxID=2898432 RepID=UPI002150AC70|nr:GAF domain-containing protein [Aquincola sp. J276]MCR5868086.1 GAF domain-containing protein [Aquincola sp. J276]